MEHTIQLVTLELSVLPPTSAQVLVSCIEDRKSYNLALLLDDVPS